jgi:hypothetical protein
MHRQAYCCAYQVNRPGKQTAAAKSNNWPADERRQQGVNMAADEHARNIDKIKWLLELGEEIELQAWARRGEAARLMYDEYQRGFSERDLAEEIGCSPAHVHFSIKAWRLLNERGYSLEDFQKVYSLAKKRGNSPMPESEPGVSAGLVRVQVPEDLFGAVQAVVGSRVNAIRAFNNYLAAADEADIIRVYRNAIQAERGKLRAL